MQHTISRRFSALDSDSVTAETGQLFEIVKQTCSDEIVLAVVLFIIYVVEVWYMKGWHAAKQQGFIYTP